MSSAFNSDTANLLAIFTMICWGVSNGFMKIPSLRLGSPKAIRLRQIVMLLVLILYKLCFDRSGFGDTYWLLVSIALGFFGYLPFYYFCQGICVGSIGVVNAIGNSFPVITLILTHYIFGATINIGSSIGIALTTIGVVVLSLSKQKSHVRHNQESQHIKAVIFAILACILWGCFYTIVPILNTKLEIIPFTMCLQFGTFISSHFHSMLQNKRQNLSSRSLKFAILAGLFAVSGSLSFYKALHFGNPAIITAIAASSPLVVALYGRFVYNERISRSEVFGILVTVLGVASLSLIKY